MGEEIENSEDVESNLTNSQLETQLETLKQTMQAEKRIMEEHFERFKSELQDKQVEIEERDRTIEELNMSVEALQKKRQNLLQKLNNGEIAPKHERNHSTVSQLPETPAKAQAQIAYNINPTKLLKFLEGLETQLKQLYKDFINYSILKDEDKMQDIQLGINTLVEQLSDFTEYSRSKLKYLKDKGFNIEGIE